MLSIRTSYKESGSNVNAFNFQFICVISLTLFLFFEMANRNATVLTGTIHSPVIPVKYTEIYLQQLYYIYWKREENLWSIWIDLNEVRRIKPRVCVREKERKDEKNKPKSNCTDWIWMLGEKEKLRFHCKNECCSCWCAKFNLNVF